MGRKEKVRQYAYKAHPAKYTRKYVNFRTHKWDEAFEAGDRVVGAYTPVGERKDGRQEKIAVMATWQLADGKNDEHLHLIFIGPVMARLALGLA